MPTIGVQMLMLKHHIEQVGMYNTLRLLRAIGYRSIEVSQIPMTPANVVEFTGARDELGIEIVALSASPTRQPGVNDPIDTEYDKIVSDCRRLHVGHVRIGMMPAAAMRSHEGCDAFCAQIDEQSRRFAGLLVDRREDLVGERTRMINRFRWHLHELDPHLDPSKASPDRAKTRVVLAERLTGFDGLVAELARDILADIDRITNVIDTLERRISHRVEEQAVGLIGLPGCGALTAAKIVGETAGIARFRSEACYARHSGVAPVPVWSGNTAGRVRMTRSGNRQLNAALHRIAVTQIRLDGEGRRYYRRRLMAGDSTTEALRCLKRRLAFQTLKTQTKPAASQPTAA